MRKFENFCRALSARNSVAHAYNKAVALDIINGTKNQYYQMFQQLKKTIEEQWL